MTRSLEELERLERELKERADSAGALDRMKKAEQMLHHKDQAARPIHRSTRGQWESQSKRGLSLPRRRS